MESRDRGWNGSSIARQGYRSFPEELNIEGECTDTAVHWLGRLGTFFIGPFCRVINLAKPLFFFVLFLLNGLREKQEEGYHFLYHIQTPLKSNNIARMV